MNDYIFNQLLPRLDCLAEKVKKLELVQKLPPQIEVNIESSNCDALISQIQNSIQILRAVAT